MIRFKINKELNKHLLLLTLLLFTVLSFGQQDAQYTQYIYNTVSVNPAYAGSRGYLSLAALYRAQWVGIEGAPETQTFNIHSPIGYKGVGLGLSFVNDEIGPTSETTFDIDISYTIQLDYDKNLSFGLKPSLNLLNVQFSELNQDISQSPDPILQQNIDNRFSPNIGAGVYYYTDSFYTGFSAPRILETTHFDESSLSTARERVNYYFIAGYVHEFNPSIQFKPAILTRAVQGAPLQVDLSANFLFNEKFIGGIAYRFDAAFSGMVGFKASNELLIGLAYDREITDLGAASFNNGSFEIIFRYDFIKALGNVRPPNFF